MRATETGCAELIEAKLPALRELCREFGVQPLWNLLYGFPGEARSDYEETVALMEAIWHLEPPTGYGPIRLDRFSPYHAEPAAFGMVDIRAVRPLPRPVTLEEAKAEKRLASMALVTNSRLSVQPVTEEEWALICKMGGV